MFEKDYKYLSLKYLNRKITVLKIKILKILNEKYFIYLKT